MPADGIMIQITSVALGALALMRSLIKRVSFYNWETVLRRPAYTWRQRRDFEHNPEKGRSVEQRFKVVGFMIQVISIKSGDPVLMRSLNN